MDEVWKDITGYEGKYKVSNMGRVKSLDRFVRCKGGGSQFRKGRILAQRKRTAGEQYVSV